MKTQNVNGKSISIRNSTRNNIRNSPKKLSGLKLLSVFTGFALYFLLYFLFLVPTADFSIASSYNRNQSVEIRVNVTNYPPLVTNVEVDDLTPSPLDEIDLTANSNTSIYCNGTVSDTNGIDDIYAINATLYLNTTTGLFPGYPLDLNDRYYSNRCTNTTISPTELQVECYFNVTYFAYNGTWICNLTAAESGGLISGSGIDDTVVQPLVAVDSPAVIDYGLLRVGYNSTTDVPVNLTNIGNVNISINTLGYGEVEGDNLSMMCQKGNISVDLMRFDLNTSNDPYVRMNNLTGTPSSMNLNVSRRINDTSVINSYNTTYWKMGAPLGVKGYCNGTVVFVSEIN